MFNISNLPHRINVTGASKATQACKWCSAHYPDECWDIGLPHFGQAQYVFSFSKPEHASEFTLRWA